MTWEEYNQLFHRAHVNEVAFKRVIDCDEELRKMVEMAIEDEREECAKVCEAGVVQTNNWDASDWNQACEIRAAAIRRRGEKA